MIVNLLRMVAVKARCLQKMIAVLNVAKDRGREECMLQRRRVDCLIDSGKRARVSLM